MTQKINNNTPCESLHEVIKYHISSSRTNFYKSYKSFIEVMHRGEPKNIFIYI